MVNLPVHHHHTCLNAGTMVEALYSEDFSLSVSDLCLTGAACSLVGRSSSLAIAKSVAQGQRQLHFERM